ncbi:LOW QUALITY PROTEIN: hypothetical protein CRUP_002688 [Coryphaenoides rupestris]|nr:LOW QUALITY PROTEIN: hypothetical protein CRUP_002688 [Coryphaenoides rupestris]
MSTNLSSTLRPLWLHSEMRLQRSCSVFTFTSFCTVTAVMRSVFTPSGRKSSSVPSTTSRTSWKADSRGRSTRKMTSSTWLAVEPLSRTSLTGTPLSSRHERTRATMSFRRTSSVGKLPRPCTGTAADSTSSRRFTCSQDSRLVATVAIFQSRVQEWEKLNYDIHTLRHARREVCARWKKILLQLGYQGEVEALLSVSSATQRQRCGGAGESARRRESLQRAGDLLQHLRDHSALIFPLLGSRSPWGRGGACPGPCSTNPYLDPSCFAPILSGPIDVVVAVPAGPGVRRVVDAGAFVVDALSIVPALRSFYATAAVSTVVAVFVSPATVALLGVGVMAVQLGLLLLFLLRVALAIKGGGKGQGKEGGGRGMVEQGPTVVVVGPPSWGSKKACSSVSGSILEEPAGCLQERPAALSAGGGLRASGTYRRIALFSSLLCCTVAAASSTRRREPEREEVAG